MPLVLASLDKFRGTATAAEMAEAVARAAAAAGWDVDRAPVADGGEGTLEALGGRRRVSTVMGPLGDLVEAEWRLLDGEVPLTAVVEMARASGLDVVGGPDGNDAVAASTYGTGELIAAACEAGARRVIVGVGGSATTDGGLGAIRALESNRRLRAVELVVACDVDLTFLRAAEVFAPQKGASPAQVALLARRLKRLAQLYQEEYGVDVRGLPGSGAAGGLAGGLAALGARLVPGFEVVSDALGLAERVAAADLVVTGEGFVDEQSFAGKAVGGMVEMATEAGVPVVVVAGEVLPEAPVPPGVEVVSLVERVGQERAMSEAVAVVEEVVAERLRAGRAPA